MKPLTVFISLGSLLAVGHAVAEPGGRQPEVDPVVEAIREFKPGTHMKPNEVTVVLPPPEEAPPSKPKDGQNPGANPADKPKEPADRTPPGDGKPAPATPPGKPQDTESRAASEPSAPSSEASKKSGTSLTVSVEKLKVGDGQVDPSKVKLSAPFPAKPLNAAPAGWRIEAPEKVAPITKEVELAPGKKITLSIRPHLLVPEADATQVFSISEPGFDPSLGYQQSATVGAILSSSIREVEERSKQMSTAIDQLQQLLGSLPKSEPPPPVAVPANPPPARTPLRSPSKRSRLTP